MVKKNEVKDLVVKEEQLPSFLMEEKADFELEQDEILTPRLQLAQPMSEVVSEGLVAPGKWYNSLTQKEYPDVIQIIPIIKTSYRVKWSDEGVGLDCFAPDGKFGIKYGKCQECPHFWARTEKGGAVCNKGISLLIYIVDTDEIVLLPVIRTKLTPIKKMLTILKTGNKPLFTYIWNLSVCKQKNDQGTFFVPELKQASVITEGLYQKVKAIRDSFKVEDIQKGIEAEVTEESGASNTDEIPM
jgi:hypothetical protein